MIETPNFDRSIVRIYSQAGEVKGAGFLVSQNQIITCAHVVDLAHGIRGNSAEKPTAEVKLDFPKVAPGKMLTAKVIFWLPVNPQEALEDIAVLELTTTVPNNAFPVRLISSKDLWEHPFRAFGFPKGRPNGVWAKGVLRGSTANGWVQLEDSDHTGYTLEEGFSGAPIWDDTLEGLVGMAVAADKQRPDARTAFIIPTNILIQAWPQLQEQLIAACPYKGLFAFQEADAEFFFGREGFTEKLVAAVARQQFVAVIGPSGSGKSSVVFAGLIPQLRSQGGWQIEQFRPKADPFDELARALVRFKQPEKEKTGQDIEALQLSRLLEEKESTLSTWLSSILEKHQGSRLLLVADQFEEIYTNTICTDTDDRKRLLFLERLLNAVVNIPDLTLVLTLRADFLGYALSHRLLADALQGIPPNPPLEGGSSKERSSRSVTNFLGPMNSQELREVIEKPAEKLGVQLEAGLTERILKDVERSPGNLPLLEFALERLWSKQRNGQLTHSAYEEVGGVEKALASYADDVYENLDMEYKEKAKRVFIQLVQPGQGTEDTRKVATRAEVGADNWNLVRRLADKRLVVTGRNQTGEKDETGEETVEVIHEALIREWGMLRGWMEDSRKFRLWQEGLKIRLGEWKQKGENSEALLRGSSLLEAQKWHQERLQELSEDEKQFIELSDRKNQQRQRRQQLTIFGLVAFGVVVSILGGLAFWQWRLADTRRKDAEMRAKITNLTARFTAAQTLDALVQGIRLGKELKDANRATIDTQILGANMLRQMVYWQHFMEYNRLDHDKQVFSVVFSPNGDLIATASADGTAKLWNLDGSLVKDLRHQDKVYSVQFSPKGDLIATASADGTAKLWNLHGSLVKDLRHQDKVYRVQFSPNGDLIATASFDGTAKLWNLDGSLVADLKHQGKVYRVQFSPNGELIATTSSKEVKLWKTADGTHQTLESQAKIDDDITFSPNGELIALASSNEVKIWKTADGNLFTTLNGDKGHIAKINDLEFIPTDSSKENLIASASDDHTVKLWKINNDGSFTVQSLENHSEPIYKVVFNSKVKRIASASGDNTIKLWNLDGTLVDTLEGHKSLVYSIAFSHDGETIASASSDKTARLWKASSFKEILTKTQCRRVAFSPNGNLIAIGCYYHNTLKLLKPDGRVLQPNMIHSSWITSVAFSHKGDLIATTSQDGKIKLWKPDGEFVRDLEDNEDRQESNFYTVTFSPNSDLIAVNLGKKVKFWKTDGTLQDIVIEAPKTKFLDIAFSPEGDLIATACDDETVKLWNVVDGSRAKTPEATSEKHGGRVYSVAFSPHGNLIATASANNTVRLSKRDDLDKFSNLEEHSGWVLGVAFNSKGDLVASASDDKTIKLWKPDGSMVYTLAGHKTRVESVAFSPKSNSLVSVSDDNTVRLWNLDIDDLLARSCDWVKNYLTHSDDNSNRHLCDDVKPSALLFLENGNTIATNNGDIDGAAAEYRKALELEPNLNFDPITEAKIVAAPGVRDQGGIEAEKGNIEVAIKAYKDAQEYHPYLQFLGENWDKLCRYGSLYGRAQDVMFACDKAVELEPENVKFRDSRGLARTLTGKMKEAVEDFKASIELKTVDEFGSKRQGWVDALSAGKNPFTPEELKSFRND